MKKVVIAFLVLAGTGILFYSCEELFNPSSLSGDLIDHSECKSDKTVSTGDETPDTLSCIKYVYDASAKKLSVTHINAGFNCCPGTLKCDFSLNGDTIIIEESEQHAQCSCDCLFDLDMEITGVEASSYIIKIEELYTGDQDKLIFDIDLGAENEGSFCVTRKQYPWGMSSLI